MEKQGDDRNRDLNNDQLGLFHNLECEQRIIKENERTDVGEEINAYPESIQVVEEGILNVIQHVNEDDARKKQDEIYNKELEEAIDELFGEDKDKKVDEMSTRIERKGRSRMRRKRRKDEASISDSIQHMRDFISRMSENIRLGHTYVMKESE